MKYRYKIVFFLILFSSSSALFAKNLWCTGKVNIVYIDKSGDVMINGTWRGTYTKLCNLKAEAPGTVTCSMWASYAAQALENKLDVTNMFSGVEESMTCNTLPTYAATPPSQYFMIMANP